MEISMNSANPQDIQHSPDSQLNAAQVRWLNDQVIPCPLYLKSATEFDDTYLDTSTDVWKFRHSGRNCSIDFENGKNFCTLSEEISKLIKFACVVYTSENNARMIYEFACDIAKSINRLVSLNHETFITLLHEQYISKATHRRFYSTLYVLRKLDVLGFFESTNHNEDLEDKLLLVPRPATDKWSIYSEIDNVLPDAMVSMIHNGLQLWSAKLTPRLSTEEAKQRHIENIASLVSIEELRDCVILGLILTTGARPVQLARTAVGDIAVDTEGDNLIRYSYAIPYAKQSKSHPQRVIVAIPEELGKLVKLYKRISGLNDGDPLLPQCGNAVVMINDAIKRQLLRFSPLEMQAAVAKRQAVAPHYTATQFRHHVGHSLAMVGVSAEEIAYVLGHSSTVVANRYIASTPDLASIREQALCRNPAFKSMITLMLTGNLVQSNIWHGRKVAGSVGDMTHYHIGGCGYEEGLCPYAQVRCCYGCLYFHPFIDGHHQHVLAGFENEIISLIKLADDSFIQHHPLLPELGRRKQHVQAVMARISYINNV
ncbi:site-specific integrase [Aeromonas australiensis]|nr:site-specific integrase [Aeromonas australiensis]